MSVVDQILKRWTKDIVQLKNAATAERTKIDANKRMIEGLGQANVVAENEAKRAERIIDNLNALLAVPTEGGKA